ncbi:PREDICTED: auxin-responsive protein IAA33 isoform X2 [Tarenaya hassleriana]|uniref:auxin-responsive protein IAA33 isoform X2 n=1 Tax=Tarenaya hassleriana TaxID=28532 RepID=UPI00053C23F8|nr:PREDICTED: auxin-responsive protein IAA33 isoform X2 [Tarenaya hassleriana]
MMNNFFDPQSQDSVERKLQDKGNTTNSATPLMSKPRKNPSSGLRFPGGEEDDIVSKVVPPVTVVLEGRSICQRVSLDKHGSYQSLARALRQMFVDDGGDSSETDDLDLSNAVPGHLIAYEDMENDLLLAGILYGWRREFVYCR